MEWLCHFLTFWKVLGLTLDDNFSCDRQISDIVKLCNYISRALQHIIPKDMVNIVACALINGWIAWLLQCCTTWRHRQEYKTTTVHNFSTRVVYHPRYGFSTTRLLQSLHWQPVERRIQFKIALTTQYIWLNHQPKYLAEFLTDYRQMRQLRSKGNNLPAVPATKTMKTKLATCAFRVAAPTTWNDFQPAIRSSSLTAGSGAS